MSWNEIRGNYQSLKLPFVWVCVCVCVCLCVGGGGRSVLAGKGGEYASGMESK